MSSIAIGVGVGVGVELDGAPVIPTNALLDDLGVSLLDDLGQILLEV